MKKSTNMIFSQLKLTVTMGEILYVQIALGAKEINMKINYKENIFVTIALNNNDALILGLL